MTETNTKTELKAPPATESGVEILRTPEEVANEVVKAIMAIDGGPKALKVYMDNCVK